MVKSFDVPIFRINTLSSGEYSIISILLCFRVKSRQVCQIPIKSCIPCTTVAKSHPVMPTQLAFFINLQQAVIGRFIKNANWD